jgi:hypothetical protein
MLESDFDCEIQPGAICACLSAADDPSEHICHYFEIGPASTECLARLEIDDSVRPLP